MGPQNNDVLFFTKDIQLIQDAFSRVPGSTPLGPKFEVNAFLRLKVGQYTKKVLR